MKKSQLKLMLCTIALMLTSLSSWARTETVTMQYTGTFGKEIGSSNRANFVGLDNTKWSLTGENGGSGDLPSLSSTQKILLRGSRLSHSYITVANLIGQTITSITVYFTEGHEMCTVTANNTEIFDSSARPVAPIKCYTINATSFKIAHNYDSENTTTISSIVITYEVPDEPITPEEPEATELNLVARTDANYYATFSNEKKVFFKASEATVNTVSVDSNGRLVIEPLTLESGIDDADGYYVPKATGVLIQSERAEGDEGNGKTIHYYTVEEPELILQEAAEEPLSGNMLKAASVPMEQEGYKFYRLAYNNFTEKTGLGFYYGSGCDNGQPFNCKAGTAYLAVPIAQEAAAPQARINYIIEAPEETNTATYIEEQPAEEDTKFVEDGQLFIRKNGIVYNTMGQIVK